MFHSKHIQYSTWCQNRGCSYISSRRRIYRSNPAVPCIFPSIPEHFYSRITILLKLPKEGGRQGNSAKCHWIQGLWVNSTQQNLHSKWQQGSPGSLCAVPQCQAEPKQFYPAETSFYVAEVSSRSLWSSLCCRKLHRRNLNRISTCNSSNTSTKVSGLQIHYLFSVSSVSTHSKKFHSILGNNSSKCSKLVFQSIQAMIVIILTKYIENGYGYVRNRS